MFKRKNPAELQAQLNAMKPGGGFSSDDKNEWKLKDTDGVGSAVIRFLPSKNEANPSPFVKLINHGFKKNNQWYIENCTSTNNDFDGCPVCKYMNERDLFNTNEKEYRLMKRKTSFYANILVIKDPAVPANEGKVFKFRFGQKIMDKIAKMAEVDTDIGEIPVDVTCVYEGANFALKCKKQGEFKNYDDSYFMKQSEIANIDDEAVQEKLSADMVDLTEILKFKSFEDNQKKFAKVLGTAVLGGAASTASAAAAQRADELDGFDADMAAFESSKPAPSEPTHSEPSAPAEGDDDLDALLAGM